MKTNLGRLIRWTSLAAFAAWAVWVPFYSLTPWQVAKAQDMEIGQWTRTSYHVSAKGTYTATFGTSYLNTVRCNISNAGTSWVLSLQNGESTPKVLWRWVTADGVGNFGQITLPVGITMTDGIHLVSSGTTAGVADIEMSFRGTANPSATPFATPTATYTPTPTPTAP